jgi:hypothetical protein
MMKRYKLGELGNEVGYKKPPKHSQFKPGQSGNPKGRPKGANNFATDIRAALKAPVNVTQDGALRRVSTQQALLMRLKAKALGGDARALEKALLLAQSYGMPDPGETVSTTADDEAILEIYRQRWIRGATDKDPPR